MTFHLATPHTLLVPYQMKTQLTITCQVIIIWLSVLFIGYRSCTSVFSNRGILLGLPSTKKTQNSLPLYSRQSNMDLIVTMIKTYFTSGVNRVRILKNLKDLQECLSSGITFMNSIQTFDISILYSILQHDNLIIGSTLSYSPMLLYKPGY